MATFIYYGNEAERSAKKVEIITASKTLNQADSGKIFGIGTDALVITLPSATAVAQGTEFTFVNTGADGNNLITLSPAAGDAIRGTVANAAADSTASGVDGKDFVNTKATANRGDFVKLVMIGADWYITDGVGIWASQA